jgi:hypothetical protein
MMSRQRQFPPNTDVKPVAPRRKPRVNHVLRFALSR